MSNARGRVPEVTSGSAAIASGRRAAEQGGMRRILATLLQPLLHPLPMAGLLTILTVGYSLRFVDAPSQPAAQMLLLAKIAGMPPVPLPPEALPAS